MCQVFSPARHWGSRRALNPATIFREMGITYFGGAYLIQQKLLKNAKRQAAAMGTGDEGDAKA